jgi:hypothetical protein
MSIPKRRLSATTRTARPTHQSSNSAVGSKDTIAQPLQIRRRIRHNDSNRIIVRDNRAQSPLRQTFKPLISGTHIQQIRAESPIGPRLVDRVPLAIRLQIRIAKVVSLAWRDEIEIERAVHASDDQSKQLGDWASRASWNSDMAGECCELRGATWRNQGGRLTVVEHDLLQIS